MSSSQGQAAWRSRSGGPGQSSASYQAQAQAQAQAPAPVPPISGPFPPGYPNAPPVQLPPSINQQQWNQGYWRFDPKPGWTSASAQVVPGAMGYNPGLANNNRPSSQASGQAQPPPGQAQAWIPHPGWQFPADFNPYKRVPKPPDPSYWATELMDNPLGLENMHITKEFIEEHDGHTMQTPWVWTSTSLSGEDQPPEPRDTRGPGAHHRISSASEQVARRSSHDHQSSSNAQDGTQYRQRVYSSSQVQSQSQPQQNHREQFHPPPPGQRQHQPASQPTNTPPRHPTLTRRHTHDSYHTPPNHSSSRRNSDAKPPQDDRPKRDTRGRSIKTNMSDSDDNDDEDNKRQAFSERKELHPTFSPAIVRTPKYYLERTNTPVSTPTRPTSNAPTRRASEPATASAQSHLAIPPPPLVSRLTGNKSEVLSPLIGATPRPSSTSIAPESTQRELRSSSSSPNDSSSHYRSSSHSQPHNQSPPSHQSSSSYSSSHSQQQSRAIARSQTYPTLDPVSEDPFSSTPRDVQSFRNPPLTSSRKSESKDRHGRTLSRSQTYPDVEVGRALSPRRALSPYRTMSPHRALSPPRSATPSRTSSRAPSRSHTPPNSGPTLPPPLPPDVLARIQKEHPNAVLTPITIRKGYWNRRGDYLTPSRHVVYAPPNLANPLDLARYPSPKQGFMNSDGHMVVWDSRMPELPESLPRYGQPPVKPYESFIQYERRWHPVDPITPP